MSTRLGIMSFCLAAPMTCWVTTDESLAPSRPQFTLVYLLCTEPCFNALK